ncbi:MAG: protein kinase [bacterium]|nr:protein kinase [bacterium]
MHVKLEVVKGPEKGRVFEIEELGITIIGRSDDAQFQFSDDDPYVSRRHFVIETSPPNLYFRDLEVTNPSRVNGDEVSEAILNDGDLIEFGFTTLQVSISLEADEVSVAAPSEPAIVEDVEPVPVSEPGQVFSVRCLCGKDLSEDANWDGCAEDLDEIVQYLCADCFSEQHPEILGGNVGDYQQVKLLGVGGMGEVFLARHRTGRMVALKVVKLNDANLAARFMREVRTMRTARHPNVVALIDNGVDHLTGNPFLVLEYAPLGSLDDLLESKNGSLAPLEAAEHILQALEGLCYVHEKGIVHRDIKPENILLTRDDDGSVRAKVADFGLAREFTKVGGSILTQIGTPMGTMFYMPPEQVLNAHGVREPADIYAMGVSLYMLLTDRFPFAFPSPGDIRRFLADNKYGIVLPQEAMKVLLGSAETRHPFNMIVDDEPIPLLERNPDVPLAIAVVVDRAIRKEISQRFPDAETFRRELEQVIRYCQ